MAGIISLLQSLVAPHKSLTDPQSKARAQLVNILSLILLVLSLVAIPFASSITAFIEISAISLLCYIFGRSPLYNFGAYLLSYSIAAIGFVRIYTGEADTIESAINTSVFIALVLASVLFSNTAFIVFVVFVTAASFASPYYSNVAVTSLDNYARSGGIVFVTGCLLFGTNLLRASIERARLLEATEINRQLEDIKANLEKRIDERTHELSEANIQIQNRATRLQTIAEVSQTITSSVDKNLHDLMTGVTELISSRMNYYHVGIFLLDQRKDFAVLQAANSEGGQRMLARRHQLKVGGTGIVGYASQSGRPRIALDTGVDAVFFNNPDLPNTRSEVAVPLKVGTEVIGVLDVQSTEPTAFNQDDVTALGTLANQIAIVIQNAQIAEGTNAPSSMAGRRSQTMGQKGRTKGFAYLPDGTISSNVSIENEILSKALESGEIVVQEQPSNDRPSVLAVPVKIRENVIGVIHIEPSQNNRKWSEDEVALIQSVSERAALAIENARLFEATERLADQERVIAQITSRIGESNDMERILHTTIQELGRTLGAKRTYIQLSAAPSNNSPSPQVEEEE
jgi:GAF domain-containing protein